MSLLRINRQPTRRQLLVFGLAWLTVFGALAGRLGQSGRPAATAAAALLAAAVPLVGLASAEWLRRIYVGLSCAVYPIGFVVSHVILALVYYVVLTPIGWLARLGGYDPLARRFDPAAPTYWRARPAPKPAESYLRQN